MYVKCNQFPTFPDRPPIGQHYAGSGGADGVIDAKTPFSSLLRNVLRGPEQEADIQHRSTPLDPNAVQELILKIGERMNDRLLSLVAGEQNLSLIHI